MMPGLGIGVYATTNIPTYPLFEPVYDGSYYLENTSPSGLPTGDSARSVFFWVKVPQPTTLQVIFGYGSSSDDSNQCELIYNANPREVTFWSSQNFSPVESYGNSDFVLAINMWYFCGMVYNGSSTITLHTFVNGIHGTSTFSHSLSTTLNKIRVGLGVHHHASYDNLFQGTIEKIGVWNRALTNDQVASYYNAGRVDYSSLPFNVVNNVTETIDDAQSCVSTFDSLQCIGSEGLDYLGVSEGGFLETRSVVISDIFTSTGAHLEFHSQVSTSAPAASFWNLTESSGTRYDSVGSNNLNPILVNANFNVTSTVAINTPVSFTDDSTLAVSWSWDFGDGVGTSTEQNPTYTYTTTGDYTVTLTINGGGHEGYSVSQNVEVEVPTASFTDNSPQPLGTPIAFTDTSTFPNGSWYWDFGDGNISTSQNPSHIYADVGDYNVSLTIDSGASDVSIGVSVTEVAEFIWQPVDLSSYFNVIGLVLNGDGGESGSGLDGNGPGEGSNAVNQTVFYGLYSNPITIDGVQFNFPSGNSNNTIYCNGQTIDLSGAKLDYLYLLGFAVNGDHIDIPFTVNYSDASSETFNLSLSDWFSPQSYSNESIALGGSGNLIRQDNAGPIYIYKYTLALDRTKNAIQLVLPVSVFIDFFAITEAISVSNLAMWVSADSLTGLNDGDYLATWTDLSPNSNNLIQNNPSNCPIYRTNIVNGLPALQFTASNEQTMAATVTADASYSVLTVLKQLVPTGTFKIAFSWGSGSGATLWQGYVPDTSPTGYPGAFVPASDSHYDTYSSYVDDTNWHIAEGVFDGSTLSGWDTGNSSIVTGVGGSGNTTGASNPLGGNTINVGSYVDSLYWQGYVAEVLVFTSNLSDSDRETIESYLIYKYDIQPQDEIQTLTFSPTPTAGTFNATITGDNDLEIISYNVSSSVLQNVFDNALGVGNVAISGSYDSDYTIEYTGSYSNMPISLMTVDATGLTAFASTITITEIQVGVSDTPLTPATNSISFGSNLVSGNFSLQHPDINSGTPVEININNVIPAINMVTDGVAPVAGSNITYVLTLGGVPTSATLLLMYNDTYIFSITTNNTVNFNGQIYSSIQDALDQLNSGGYGGSGYPWTVNGIPADGTTITFTGQQESIGSSPWSIRQVFWDTSTTDGFTDGQSPVAGVNCVQSLALTGAFGGTWGLNGFDGIPWNIDQGTLYSYWTANTQAITSISGTGTEEDPWIVQYSAQEPVSLPTITGIDLAGFTSDFLQNQITGAPFTVTGTGPWVFTSNDNGSGQTEITATNVDMIATVEYEQPQVITAGVAPSTGVNATYTITLSGAPGANYLVLLYNGTTEVDIHYDGTGLVSSVQDELDQQELSEWTYSGSPGSGTIAFTGPQTPFGYNPWSVEFNYWSDVGVSITSATFVDGVVNVVGENCVMSLTLNGATGGNFGINSDAENISPLIYNIAEGDLQAVWESATGKTISSLTGSGTNDDPWIITYSEQAPEDVPFINGSALTTDGTITNMFVDGTSTEGQNEIQTISLADSPTGGSWTLTFNGTTQSPLPYNMSAATLQTAMQNGFLGTITVSGDASLFTVDFGTHAPQSLFTADGSSLTKEVTATVIRIQQGQSL